MGGYPGTEGLAVVSDRDPRQMNSVWHDVLILAMDVAVALDMGRTYQWLGQRFWNHAERLERRYCNKDGHSFPDAKACTRCGRVLHEATIGIQPSNSNSTTYQITRP